MRRVQVSLVCLVSAARVARLRARRAGRRLPHGRHVRGHLRRELRRRGLLAPRRGEPVDAGGTVRLPPASIALDPHGSRTRCRRHRPRSSRDDRGHRRDRHVPGRIRPGRPGVRRRGRTSRFAISRCSAAVPVGTGGLVRATAGSTRAQPVTMFGGRAETAAPSPSATSATASIDRSWIFGNRRPTAEGGSSSAGRRSSRDRRSRATAPWGEGARSSVHPHSLYVRRTPPSRATWPFGAEASGPSATSSSSSRRSSRTARAWAARRSISTTSESSTANSVFARNEASDRGPLCVRPLSSAGRNVADVRGCGLTASDDIAGVDPRVGTLRQNGGPTPTHALKIDSPAVDRGSGCHPTDQRGAPRSGVAIRLRQRRVRARVLSRPPGDDRRDSR